jgi:hypothetical protein
MSAEAVYDTREKIANFLNTEKPENVVFTYNATYALNLALKTLITEKCHVLTSDIEHNSVIRPLEKLKRTLDIEYSVFDSDGDVEANIIKGIRQDTKCIVSTLSSNVTGKAIPFENLSKVATQYGLKLINTSSPQAVAFFKKASKKMLSQPCELVIQQIFSDSDSNVSSLTTPRPVTLSISLTFSRAPLPLNPFCLKNRFIAPSILSKL